MHDGQSRGGDYVGWGAHGATPNAGRVFCLSHP